MIFPSDQERKGRHMKKAMRKRSLLAVLLAMCMVVMLMPAAAFAEDENGVSGIKDTPGGAGIRVDTTVRDNYTDLSIIDDIDMMAGEGYIIDFTKEDDLSYALKALAGQNGTRYYKFQNSDNKALVETENQEEALLKFVVDKDENQAVMTLVNDASAGASYQLDFIYTQYTGSMLTYTGTTTDPETKEQVIGEIRDDYYTRYNFKCKLNLNTADIESGIIKTIRIDNAKLSFKTGAAPEFTANVTDGYGDFYTLFCQDWSVGPWESSTQIVHASDTPDRYAFKSFEKDKKYYYSVFVELTSAAGQKNCRFDENTRLILNGKEVTYSSKAAGSGYVYFYDVAAMAPTDEAGPQPGQDGSAAGKTDPEGNKSDSAAKTGDAADPMLYAGILLLAAAGAGTAVLYRRKAKN